MGALALGVCLLAPGAVLAAGAPALAKSATRNANDLQRAAWACEAGARSLASAGPSGRFFLGGLDPDAGQGDKPTLILEGDRLTGFGRLSDDQEWSNIHFACTLSPGLGRANTFIFDVLSPIDTAASEHRSGVVAARNSARMTWSVGAAGPVTLVHGVKETDDRDFIADCATHSRQIEVRLTRTVKWLKADGYVTVGISTGAKSGLYVARGVMNDEFGAIMPVFTLDANDPLIDWMAAGASLLINVGDETVYTVSLKGAARAAKTFAAACQ